MYLSLLWYFRECQLCFDLLGKEIKRNQVWFIGKGELKGSNKPGADAVPVVVHHICQCILIYSGALCTVAIIHPLVLWDNFYNEISSGQYWTTPEVWSWMCILVHNPISVNLQSWISGSVMKNDTCLCGPGILLETKMVSKAGHEKT